VLTARTAIDGWLVELSDVAGLRSTEEALEAAGVARAEQETAVADLVVFVADLTTAWDAELYEQVHRRATTSNIARSPIIVHNKCDLAELDSAERPAGIKTSAMTGIGLPELCQIISTSLVPSPPDRGSAIPFTPDHLHQLHEAATALNRGEIPTANGFIQAIIGVSACQP
jgi:tRNA modification GTPase